MYKENVNYLAITHYTAHYTHYTHYTTYTGIHYLLINIYLCVLRVIEFEASIMS